MALGLSVGMFADIGLGFAGCDDGKTDVPDTPIVNPNEDPNKVKEPDKNPDKENPSVDVGKFEEKKSELEHLTSTWLTDRKFKYVFEDNEKTFVAKTYSDKMEFDYNGEKTYLENGIDAEEATAFIYKPSDNGYFEKDYAESDETIDFVAGTIDNAFRGISWDSYDNQSNQLLGTATTSNGKVNVEANFDETNIKIKWKTNSEECLTLCPEEHPVSLPDKIKDNTKIISFDKNNNIVLNSKLISETIKKWWTKEYCQKLFGNEHDLIDIFAVEYKDDRISLYTYMTAFFTYKYHEPCNSIRELVVPRTYVQKFLSEGKLTTAKDLIKNILNNEEYYYPVNYGTYSAEVEDSTLDPDYESSQKEEEYKILTNNIFEKYHNEKSKDDPNYNGAKILFAFRTPPSDTNLASNGYGKQWEQNYILEKDGKIEWIKFTPRGLNSGLGFYENVLQNQKDKWTLEFGCVKVKDLKIEDWTLNDNLDLTIGHNNNLTRNK